MFMKTMELRIDTEFESKIPPLTDDELVALHKSILAEGKLISPLVVWNGIIVDGHNRYRFICKHPGIKYGIYEKDFADRNDAIAWICKNQLGRRNLTPEQKKYLIGKQYEAEKQSHGGDRKSKYQNDTLNEGETTGDRIASENNMSRISVIRAEAYAAAVDLADEAVPGIKEEILSGRFPATDAEVLTFAKTAPEDRATYAEKLREPREPKSKGYRYNRGHYSGSALPERHLLTLEQIASQELAEGCKGTPDTMLYEIKDALDCFIFRWSVCLSQHKDYFEEEVSRAKINQFAREGIAYLNQILKGEIPLNR